MYKRQVLVVYYPVEEKDSSLIMMNYSEGGLLKMYLKERRMERNAARSNGFR